MQKVIIIGAGPAGLSAALKLVKNNFDINVVESTAKVGGLSKSIHLWDQYVDLGPHRFFTKDEEVLQFWKNAAHNEVIEVKRLTRIYYKSRFFYYPLQPLDIFLNLGLIEAMKCTLSFFKAQINSKESDNFEGWIKKKFGRRLYEIFFKTYTEKLWGIPCHELDANWARQRIRDLSFTELLKSFLIKKNKLHHRSLSEVFFYPVGGSGRVYECMAETILQLGAKINFNSFIKEIQATDNKVTGVVFQDGRHIECDYLISSIPLNQLVSLLPSDSPELVSACANIKFRNTILVYVEINGSNPFPDNWIYMHSSSVLHGRITNFSNWNCQPTAHQSSNILCLEYWCFDHDLIWSKKDNELGELAIKELKDVGIISNKSHCKNTHVEKLHRSYPLYEKGYKKNVAVIKDHLQIYQNLYPIGRNGSFKYNNQDHSILMGLLAAKSIITGVQQDLWEINEDFLYHET
jgi:protoporphyrinogen oxidase